MNETEKIISAISFNDFGSSDKDKIKKILDDLKEYLRKANALSARKKLKGKNLREAQEIASKISACLFHLDAAIEENIASKDFAIHVGNISRKLRDKIHFSEMNKFWNGR